MGGEGELYEKERVGKRTRRDGALSQDGQGGTKKPRRGPSAKPGHMGVVKKKKKDKEFVPKP